MTCMASPKRARRDPLDGGSLELKAPGGMTSNLASSASTAVETVEHTRNVEIDSSHGRRGAAEKALSSFWRACESRLGLLPVPWFSRRTPLSQSGGGGAIPTGTCYDAASPNW